MFIGVFIILGGLGRIANGKTGGGLFQVALGASAVWLMGYLRDQKLRRLEEAQEHFQSKQLERVRLADELIRKHAHTLRRKRKQSVRQDDYGSVLNNAWNKENEYFLTHVLEPRFAFPNDGVHWHPAEDRGWVFQTIDRVIDKLEFSDPSARVDVSTLDPIEYETHCDDLLRQPGWQSRVTPGTGDQGVHVFAEAMGQRLVVQVKKYSSRVGKKAVQQATAGREFEGADLAAVVSNAPYTDSAKRLAATAGVFLLHDVDLPQFQPPIET